MRCRAAYAIWLLCGLPVIQPALAQPVETVQVLAARPVAGQGVQTLDAARIDAAGNATLAATLEQLPQFGGQGINDAQDDNGYGEDFLDLRSLDFNRTLVLVNGSRFVLSGIRTDEAVDLNVIPSAFVERVEVHADGTQPQYGSDAVAGAVNLVLQDHFDGVRLQAYAAAAGAGDDGTAGLSLLAGRAITDGHVTIGLDLLQRDPVLQSNRAWAANPITGTDENGLNQIGSPASLAGHAVGTGIDAQGINAQALGGGASRPFDDATDRYDFAATRDLQGGLRRASGLVSAQRRIGTGITADVRLLYTDRDSVTLLPPTILGLDGTTRHPDGFVVPATAPGNPFGAPVTLERVVGEAGAQPTHTTGPVWQITAELSGDIDAAHWALSFDHGQSLSRYVTPGQINLTRALQTVGAAPCDPAAGCVAADWFGTTSLSPQALRSISYTSRTQSDYALTIVAGTLSRPLFTLPGGPARLSLSGDYRLESGATTVDAVTAAGDQAGADAAPTSGADVSREAAATLDLPLLSHRPWAEQASLQLAARETSTNRYGSFPTLRAALVYAPAAGITFHAVAGTSRRPPAIAEAFGGVTDLALPVTDPCDAQGGLRANPVVDRNCRAQGLGTGFAQASPTIAVANGGNPALRPERGRNASLGIILHPAVAPFLAASLDAWTYAVDDAIDSLADTDPNLIGSICYGSAGLSSPLCSQITRIAGGGNAGQISRILAPDENVGSIRTSGLDTDIALDRTLQGLGRATLDWQTSWLLDYRIRTIGQPRTTQYAGSFPGLNAVGLYPRAKSRLAAGLQRDGWQFDWVGRYTSAGRVLDSDERAPAILYQDLDASRRFGRVTIAAGIRNLADTRPPLLLDGETNTDTATYDVVGRSVWLRITCTL